MSSWETFASFVRGIVWGILLVLMFEASAVYLFFRRVSQHPRNSSSKAETSSETLPNSGQSAETQQLETAAREKDWPEHVLKFLRDATAVRPNQGPEDGQEHKSTEIPMTPTESCFWLNVMIHRYFLEMRHSEQLKTKYKRKLLDKLSAKMEKTSLIAGVEVVDLDFGVNPPVIHGVRVLKYYSPTYEVTCELDVTYKGGVNVTISCTITGGLRIPVTVTLTSLAGKLRCRLPATKSPTCINFSFVQDPNSKFSVESFNGQLDERLGRTIDNFMASKVKTIFNELWVMPNWRTFTLPLIGIKPTEEESKSNQSAMAVNKVPSTTHKVLGNVASSVAGGVAYVSRNITPVLRKPSSSLSTASLSSSTINVDIFDKICWPLTKVVSPNNARKLADSLVSTILQVNSDAIKSTDNTSEAAIVRDAPPIETGTWQTVRRKLDIAVERRTVNVKEFGLESGQDAINGSLRPVQAEFLRGVFQVPTPAEDVFQILSQPEHLRHIESCYLGTVPMRQYANGCAVRQTVYKFSKTVEREYFALEVNKRISSLQEKSDDSNHVQSGQGQDPSASASDQITEPRKQNELNRYVCAIRSVGGILLDDKAMLSSQVTQRRRVSSNEPESGERRVDVPSGDTTKLSGDQLLKRDVKETLSVEGAKTSVNETSASPDVSIMPKEELEDSEDDAIIFPLTENTGMVYLYGYIIEPMTNTNATRVTLISHLDAKLSRLQVTWNTCRQLKVFIEELTSNLTSAPDSFVVTSAGRSNSDPPPASSGPGIVKLRNYLNTTKTSLGKGVRGIQGWLKSGAPMPGIRNSLELTSLGESTLNELSQSESVGSGGSEGYSSADEEESVPADSDSDRQPSLERRSIPYQPLSDNVPDNQKSIIAVTLPNNDIEHQPWMGRNIGPRQTFHLILHYDGHSVNVLEELVWEFKITYKSPITFGIFFKPDKNFESSQGSLFRLLPDTDSLSVDTTSTSSVGTTEKRMYKVVMNPNSFFAHNQVVQGNFLLSEFPKGDFIFVWDSGTKRGETKMLSYHAGVRLVKAMSLLAEYAQQHVAEAIVKQRGTFKLSLMLQDVLLCDDNQDPCSQSLSWEFSTGGYDVVFGILYTAPESIRRQVPNEEEKRSANNNPEAIPETEKKPVLDKGSRIKELPDKQISSVHQTSGGDALKELPAVKLFPVTSVPKDRPSQSDLNSLLPRHTILMPLTKQNSNRGLITGSIPISKPGLYTLVFDNAWSLLTSKYVTYKVSIVTRRLNTKQMSSQ